MHDGAHRQDFDAFECSKPGCNCTTVELTGKCHPEAPVFAVYEKQTGILSLYCVECQKLAVAICVCSANLRRNPHHHRKVA